MYFESFLGFIVGAAFIVAALVLYNQLDPLPKKTELRLRELLVQYKNWEEHDNALREVWRNVSDEQFKIDSSHGSSLDYLILEVMFLEMEIALDNHQADFLQSSAHSRTGLLGLLEEAKKELEQYPDFETKAKERRTELWRRVKDIGKELPDS